MSYWEYEITDKDFEILMLYIKTQKDMGVKVYYNEIPPEGVSDILILNSMCDWFNQREKIESWLLQNSKYEYEKIKSKFKNSDWKEY